MKTLLRIPEVRKEGLRLLEVEGQQGNLGSFRRSERFLEWEEDRLALNTFSSFHRLSEFLWQAEF